MPLNYAGPHGMLADRQHVAAVLSQARRDAALSRRPVRRGAQRSMGGHLRRRSGRRPRTRPRLPAQHGVGQQRDRRQPAPGAQDPRAPSAGAVDWRWSIRCARKIAEQADLHLALQARHRRAAGLRAGRRARAAGRLRPAFIDQHVQRLRGVHERWRANGRRRPPPRHAACPPKTSARSPNGWRKPKPLVLAPGNGLERGRNGGSGIRAAIALPALLGKLGRRSGIVLGARGAFPQDACTSSRGPIWCRGHANPEYQRYRPPSRARRPRPAAAGLCSFTITTRSSCIPTRTA